MSRIIVLLLLTCIYQCTFCQSELVSNHCLATNSELQIDFTICNFGAPMVTNDQYVIKFESLTPLWKNTNPQSDSVVRIFNYISPNNDGKNDYFEIHNLTTSQNYTLKIFNKLGNVIFTTSDYLNNWNGNPEDRNETYFYELVVDNSKWRGCIFINR